MDIGISTGCLYPMLTEDCIKALCDIGFRNFEIFFNTFSELETDCLDNMLKIISNELMPEVPDFQHRKQNE